MTAPTCEERAKKVAQAFIDELNRDALCLRRRQIAVNSKYHFAEAFRREAYDTLVDAYDLDQDDEAALFTEHDNDRVAWAAHVTSICDTGYDGPSSAPFIASGLTGVRGLSR